MNDEITLCIEVANKCKDDPSFIKEIINAAVSGINKRIKDEVQYGADMEILASQMMFMAGPKRVSPSVKKQVNELALSKIQKHYDKKNLKLRWDSFLEFAKED